MLDEALEQSMSRTIVNAILVRNGTILLARRGTHRKACPSLWSFPGGHVEPGETLDAALLRELGEEIGVVPTAFRPIGTIADAGAASADAVVSHLDVVQAWSGGEPVMLGDEHVKLRWLDLDLAAELPDLALAEYPGLFAQLRHGLPA